VVFISCFQPRCIAVAFGGVLAVMLCLGGNQKLPPSSFEDFGAL